MYKIGDYIIYENTGVCKVDNIAPYNEQNPDYNKLYYTLQPVYEAGTIYVPVESNAYMRPIINKETVDNLITKIPEIKETDNFFNYKRNRLVEYYKSLLKSHNCEDLIQLLREIYQKNDLASKSGKKLGQTDLKYMKYAENILYGEFSIALGITKDEVHNYISSKLESLDDLEKSS